MSTYWFGRLWLNERQIVKLCPLWKKIAIKVQSIYHFIDQTINQLIEKTISRSFDYEKHKVLQ